MSESKKKGISIKEKLSKLTPVYIVALYGTLEGVIFTLHSFIQIDNPDFNVTLLYFEVVSFLLLAVIFYIVYREDILLQNKRDWSKFGINIFASIIYVGGSIVIHLDLPIWIIVFQIFAIIVYAVFNQPKESEKQNIKEHCAEFKTYDKDGNQIVQNCFHELIGLKNKPYHYSDRIPYSSPVYFTEDIADKKNWNHPPFYIELEEVKGKGFWWLSCYRKYHEQNPHKLAKDTDKKSIEIHKENNSYYCYIGDIGSFIEPQAQKILAKFNKYKEEIEEESQ